MEGLGGWRGTKGPQVASWHWITELMRVELIPNLGISRGTSNPGASQNQGNDTQKPWPNPCQM